MVGPRRTWLARTLPVPDNSSCVVSKVIMSGEAAARPQKLQKLRQVVHGLDKSAGGGKFLRLGKMAYLCLLVMI
jgi:hypothetical protein